MLVNLFIFAEFIDKMSDKIIPIRGMRDIEGGDARYFSHVVEVAEQAARLFGFETLITPVLEFSSVFYRGVGSATDIVSKETYSFEDRDGSQVTMRPEFTAGVVRGLISNGYTQSLPKRYFSWGPLFRHERPQKGRYRQFHQINYEHFGADSCLADVDIIELAVKVLDELGLMDHVTLNLNSLGDQASRAEYNQALFAYLSKYESELSEDSRIRLHKNPLRILDSKDANDQKIVEGAPRLMNTMNAASQAHFAKVRAALDELGIKYIINQGLVRGPDYYTHTVFEFVTDKLGAQGTVLGGGRYDGLVEKLGGPAIPAVGFAAGIERLYELVMELNHIKLATKLVMLMPIGDRAVDLTPRLARTLRAHGVQLIYEAAGQVGKRMKKADKLAINYAVIYGDDELASGVYRLRNLLSGEEMALTEMDLIATLKKA